MNSIINSVIYFLQPFSAAREVMESNYYGPVCLQAHSTAGSNQQIKLETEPVKGIRTRSSTLSFRRRPSDPELLCPRCRR
nr:hypothetical protein Iba_scaffold42821CG0010 [Ipomoea batatas]GMD52653.1 hypothetical protein Iba_chr11bCG13680 [Ipomoea batatas]GMD55202.1 hypothetical protein Iba_chr11dCG5690 [Ipomoea batatas]GMD74994.1 hypothetical protein Iba_chr13aCG10630 [Ipomoea batatas]